jgi:hypothetical protein
LNSFFRESFFVCSLAASGFAGVAFSGTISGSFAGTLDSKFWGPALSDS